MQIGVVEDDLRMCWLPAIEQTLQIIGEADAEMRIDASLTAAAARAKPSQSRLVNVDRPVEAIFRRTDSIVRPLAEFAHQRGPSSVIS